MGRSEPLADRDPIGRAEVLHESERARATRLFLPGRTVIRKEALGPDAQRGWSVRSRSGSGYAASKGWRSWWTRLRGADECRKYSNASAVHVTVETIDGGLRLSISDDGVGGADPTRGTGLVGLMDRVEATGGTLTVQSRPGEGTHVTVELPVHADLPSLDQGESSPSARL